MACRPTEVPKQYGYEDSRFERDVDENFHCSICYNVLKEPRTCKNNEHLFCLFCITKHLKGNSQTCPQCKEYLSVETLRPARVLNNYLSKLKINCDYASRGCPEYVCVEDLKTHVENCGFAPVLCSNEECGMEINKQERVHHETVVCEYRNRKVKCHDCGQIQEVVRKFEESSVKELNQKVEGVNEKLERMEGVNAKMEVVNKKVYAVNEKVEVVNEKVEGVNEKVEGVNKKVDGVNGKMEGVHEKVESINEKIESLVAAREEMKKEVKDVNEKVEGVNEKVKGVNEKVERLVAAREEMKKEVEGVNEKVEGLNEKMEGVNEKVEGVNEKMEGVNKEVEGVNKKAEGVKEKVEGVNKKVEDVNKKVEDMNEKVERLVAAREEMKREVKGVKENLSKVNKDVDEVKVMMSQMLEKLNMIQLFNKLPSPTEGVMNASREDILITGGGGVTSTEIYFWEKNGWFKVSEMSESHEGASSFIYNDQLFVVGGADTKTIETLNLSKLPLKWSRLAGELPYECGDHQTVVHQQRILHIGGCDYTRREISNMISELQLTSPCTMKELCQMPEPRRCHGAEIFEDKVLILGGYDDDYNALDSVLEFVVKKKKVKKMARLPCALWGMATVRWRDKVVVLGGRDGKNNILNDVYMYDCKTCKITALPPMLEKRCRCCAVITGDTIVVMGGANEKRITLSSVECFTMGGSTWEYLPFMNKVRLIATAQVFPSTRKYV